MTAAWQRGAWLVICMHHGPLRTGGLHFTASDLHCRRGRGRQVLSGAHYSRAHADGAVQRREGRGEPRTGMPSISAVFIWLPQLLQSATRICLHRAAVHALLAARNELTYRLNNGRYSIAWMKCCGMKSLQRSWRATAAPLPAPPTLQQVALQPQTAARAAPKQPARTQVSDSLL